MTKENTFAVSLTLEDLKRRRLVIPCFQRPYRWSRDGSSFIFDDLMAFLGTAEFRYSLGTIVTARLDPRGDELFVLDEQRLTTVALLENVLERRLDEKMADVKAPLPPKWLSYRNLPEGMSFPGELKQEAGKRILQRSRRRFLIPTASEAPLKKDCRGQRMVRRCRSQSPFSNCFATASHSTSSRCRWNPVRRRTVGTCTSRLP